MTGSHNLKNKKSKFIIIIKVNGYFQELAVALNREKELTNENQTLRLEVNTKLKRSEIKLNESFMESVGSKAKVS